MKSFSSANLTRILCLSAITLAGALIPAAARDASATGQTFASPEAAVAALAAAVQTTNVTALREIFGPRAEELLNPDPVQATQEYAAFATALGQAHRLIPETATRRVLEIGNQAYPFCVPLIQQDGRWFFDTTAGCEEIISRRIGRNELATLRTVRVYFEAQREYARRDRDGSGVLQFAQKLRSTPGRKDGLYWAPDLDGEISPLGPFVAAAQQEGYGRQLSNPDAAPEPFHGYFFKILNRQGRHAPGGKYRYLINGRMIGGFALVAWPAEYGRTGIMTFIVNQQGRVYQKDLGPRTATLASRMQEFNPDATWPLSRD